MKRPNYRGIKDEIVRLHIETDFEIKIPLSRCKCGAKPKPKFKSCHDYFIECPSCGAKTRMYRHLYEAKQIWNETIRKEKSWE